MTVVSRGVVLLTPRAGRGVMSAGVAIVIVNFDGERLLPELPRGAVRADACAGGDRRRRQRLARRLARAAARAPPATCRVRRARSQLRLRRRGANRGVAATTAPWVCVLNSDATPAARAGSRC